MRCDPSGTSGFWLRECVSVLVWSVLAACLAGLWTQEAAADGNEAENAAEVNTENVELVEHCLDMARLSHGVCAMLGCTDERLPLAMHASEDFYVHVLDPRQDRVSAARSVLDRAHAYGQRAVVERGSLAWLPYANRTIDLVLALDLTAEQLGQLSSGEILRALRPGGVAVIGQRRSRADKPASLAATDLQKWVDAADVEMSQVVEDEYGLWAQLTRPPMKGTDSWSHWEHGPDNNPVSTDSVIKAPYMTQWLGNPWYIAMPAITTSAGGRLFIAMGHIAHHKREEPWLNTLLARNAYNGKVLWKRKLPDGYLVHRSAFIATEETFYMIDPDGTGCLLLDPETGLVRERLSIPKLQGDHWQWMAIQDGILYLLAGAKQGAAETTVVRSERTHWSWGELSRGYYGKRVPWGFGESVVAYDLGSRKSLWMHSEERGIDSRAMVMGDGRVYYYGPDSHVACLDMATGETVWINDDPEVIQLIEEPGRGLSSTPGFRSACFSIYTPGALVFEAQTRMNVVALSPADGRMLWQHKKTTNNPNMIYTDDRLYVGVGEDGNTLAIDPVTGEELEDLGFKKRSCARLTATPDSFFCRGWPEGLTRYDRQSGKVQFNGAFRPSCNDGVVPANGLLYVGPWACDCNLSVMGRVALASARDFVPSLEARSAPAFAAGEGDAQRVQPLEVVAEDWPTYRGNTARTASSDASIGGALSRIWQYAPEVDYQATAPTAAGGLLFVGGDDGKVRAFDAATGRSVWSFLTAGPILQPPTIDAGRAYVGSGDGHVYALEAATGRLLWRFRVAPVDRRIMVYDRLCSTWPVNSGVVVRDGVAYAAAGIIDYDGTYVCALDAVTGKLKWRNENSGHLDPELRKGASAQGTLTIANGRLWMASGNVVSPAAYDLATGEYQGEMPEDGSPRTNRGEEVALLAGRYVVTGGRLRYSAARNVVNPGEFVARAIGTGRQLGNDRKINDGKISPAWDGKLLALVDGRDKPLKCYELDQLQTFLKTGNDEDYPDRRWVADELRDTDIVSIALAKDAILAVSATPRPRDWRKMWSVCSVDREKGQLVSREKLPAEASPGGLLVDRDGRVVVVLQNGGLVCYGSRRALAASVRKVVAGARQKPEQRPLAIAFLRGALRSARSAESHELARTNLESLGVRVGDQAAKNGCITRWHILGEVPWDNRKNTLDQKYVNEPHVDVARPCQLGARQIPWRQFVTDHADGKLDLVELIGPPGNVAAYAYSEIDLPKATDLLLKVGSNDGFCCWFNGQEVGRFEGGRSYQPDQDSLPITARQGANKVLLKVTQHGGDWEFSARLTDRAGVPVNLSRPADKAP